MGSKRNKKGRKRILAWLVCVGMALQSMPVSALASEQTQAAEEIGGAWTETDAATFGEPVSEEGVFAESAPESEALEEILEEISEEKTETEEKTSESGLEDTAKEPETEKESNTYTEETKTEEPAADEPGGGMVLRRRL